MVEQLALEQGVELTTNSLKVNKGEGSFDTLLISYSVSGTQQRVETLLQLFETLPYDANISTLSLQYTDEKGFPAAAGNITLTVSLFKI